MKTCGNMAKGDSETHFHGSRFNRTFAYVVGISNEKNINKYYVYKEHYAQIRINNN